MRYRETLLPNPSEALDCSGFVTSGSLSQMPARAHRKKPLKRGFELERMKAYFFTQALSFSFSFFVQSTFLSSILPPPWLPAKAGADTSMKAETIAVITNFIEAPCGVEVVKKAQNHVDACANTVSS